MVHTLPQNSPAVETLARSRDQRRQGHSRHWRAGSLAAKVLDRLRTERAPQETGWELMSQPAPLFRSDSSICIWQRLTHVILPLFIATLPPPPPHFPKSCLWVRGDPVEPRTTGGTTPTPSLWGRCLWGFLSTDALPRRLLSVSITQPLWPSLLGSAHTKGRGRKAARADGARCLSSSFSLLRVLHRCSIANAPAHSLPVTLLAAGFYLVQGISKYARGPFTGASSPDV